MTPHSHDEDTRPRIEPDHQASAGYLMDLLIAQIEQAALKEGAIQALHQQKQVVERELEAAVMTVGQLRQELQSSRDEVQRLRSSGVTLSPAAGAGVGDLTAAASGRLGFD